MNTPHEIPFRERPCQGNTYLRTRLIPTPVKCHKTNLPLSGRLSSISHILLLWVGALTLQRPHKLIWFVYAVTRFDVLSSSYEAQSRPRGLHIASGKHTVYWAYESSYRQQQQRVIERWLNKYSVIRINYLDSYWVHIDRESCYRVAGIGFKNAFLSPRWGRSRRFLLIKNWFQSFVFYGIQLGMQMRKISICYEIEIIWVIVCCREVVGKTNTVSRWA